MELKVGNVSVVIGMIIVFITTVSPQTGCVDDSDCSGEHVLCNEYECTCQAGYTLSENTCTEIIGGFCYSVSDCPLEHATCDETQSMCTCNSGYIESNSSTCVSENDTDVTVEYCSDDTDCGDNMACDTDNFCICIDGYIVVNNRCTNNVSVECFTDDDCGYNMTCLPDGNCTCPDGYIRTDDSCNVYVECVVDDDCENNMTCDPYGNCTCPDGFIRTDDSCNVDVECVFDDDCGNNMSCDSYGNCTCPDGYIRINDTCNVDVECVYDYDCGNNMTCDSYGNCTCPDGYIRTNDSCNVDVECVYDYDCGNNMTCDSYGNCTCPDGYIRTNDSCNVDVECVFDDDCGNNMTCDSYGNCTCPDGYIRTNDSCNVDVQCVFDDDCGNNMTCDSYGNCTCPDGYIRTNDSCNVDNQCVYDYDCGNNMTCDSYGNCTCPDGYIRTNDSCNVDVECVYDYDCGNNMTCDSYGNCTCNESFIWNGDNCTADGVCLIDDDCRNNMTCGADGNCTCPTGFIQSGENCTVEVECVTDDDCENGMICSSYANCTCSVGLSWTGYSCTADAECFSDSDCNDTWVCSPDGDCICDVGFIQVEAICVRNDCTSDADCATNEVCIADGVCICPDGNFIYQAECVRNPDPLTLSTANVLVTKETTNEQYTVALTCAFNINHGYMYQIKWFVSGDEVQDTGQVSSSSASVAAVLTDDDFTIYGLTTIPFNTPISCSVVAFTYNGSVELMEITSGAFIPIQISTNFITFMRGQSVTITVTLNIPYGCSGSASECHLNLELFDPDDNYRCWDTSIAAVHKNTCGGRIEGATDLGTNEVTSQYHVTNITLTSKINNRYYMRDIFQPEIQTHATGNPKLFWNSFKTQISVYVSDSYFRYYSWCYSFVDPHMGTFDHRWFENQNIGEFTLYRHTKLPIEVQMVTKSCNSGWATCACAVTMRAGGDIFTINHCHGHLTDYLSNKDGILKVYTTWPGMYQIVFPTGMVTYVYVMPYYDYTMNIMIYPSPNDIGQVEGLCGNFNGDSNDDLVNRNTGEVWPYTNWWSGWQNYLYPDTVSFSWELSSRQEESLLNSAVYLNPTSWKDNEKMCVCPYLNSGDHVSLCSAHEEDTCTWPGVYRWGSLIGTSHRNRRDSHHEQDYLGRDFRDVHRRLDKMVNSWRMHIRKANIVKRQSGITFEEAWMMCDEEFQKCPAAASKDDVNTDYNNTLDNCARDVMLDGKTTWVTPHCDAHTQTLLVEIEKDENITKNNPDLVTLVKENSCPSNCSSHGNCVNGSCICHADFGTDLCLLQLSLDPILEEVADDGVCAVPCEYIGVVGGGFVENVTCDIIAYTADTSGNFTETGQFVTGGVYLNYNEILVPTEINGTSTRRKRDVTNDTDAVVAKMIAVSLSNDGVNFGARQTVVILDTVCQQTKQDEDNNTILVLKSGYCYIAGTCITDGTEDDDSCYQCKPDTALFDWTYICKEDEDEDVVSPSLVVLIVCSVIGGILVVLSVCCIKVHIGFDTKKVAPFHSNTGSWNTRFDRRYLKNSRGYETDEIPF